MIKNTRIFIAIMMLLIFITPVFLSGFNAAASTAPQVWTIKKVNDKICSYKKTKLIAKNKYNKVDKYTTVDVNFRGAPNENGKIYKVIPAGKKITTYGTYTTKTNGIKWKYVKINGKWGYVRAKYLTSNKPIKTIYSPSTFMFKGVIYWGGWRWTWYSQNVLPGGGLRIPGRHVNSMGYVCDGNGYICLAATSLRKGTIVDTPFGAKGKVYDSGCPYGTLDVYTNW